MDEEEGGGEKREGRGGWMALNFNEIFQILLSSSSGRERAFPSPSAPLLSPPLATEDGGGGEEGGSQGAERGLGERKEGDEKWSRSRNETEEGKGIHSKARKNNAKKGARRGPPSPFPSFLPLPRLTH